MNLQNEFEPIRDWAKAKGIYEKGDMKTQALKLAEEAGELAKAILNNDEAEIIDAIGDQVVVLTNLAKLADQHFHGKPGHRRLGFLEPVITLESCVNSAYNVIKNRTGNMSNGTFVKDEGQ